MIPTTALGLAVFTAGLGPGYLFLRVEERRRPRPERSGLLEAIELLVIGSFASLTAALVTFGTANLLDTIDDKALAADGRKYVIGRSPESLAFVIVTLTLAYALAWVAARVVFWRTPPSIAPVSAWHEVLRDRPNSVAYVTVGLDDGFALAGDVAAYTVDDRAADQRELVVESPEFRPVGASFFSPAREQFVVIRGDRIRTLSVIHYQIVRPQVRRFAAGRKWLASARSTWERSQSRDSPPA